MSPELDYATRSLIAYIGNKRALLPFLREVFLELNQRERVSRFLDPFAGSGSVSRLARSLGWKVMANDLEPYSWAVNACWLCLEPRDLDSLFAAEGGLAAVFGLLNSLHPLREDLPGVGASVDAYIARHYAPLNTALADWRRERLFYTRENAIFLDRARQAIDELRPPSGPADARSPQNAAERERAALLGPLVYEAATHANTSGVFKAFHKGYGGHSRDALGRILAPMRLEMPRLWEGPAADLGRGEAAAFCSGRIAELCYLDPPYNQHQYGSNYHLLNTLVTWNRRPIDEEREGDGGLRSKAGIPPDWKERRSAFCSRATAAAAFRELLAEVDARFIVLSYNSEGIVPAEELYDLLSLGAAVRIRSLRYFTYRGGRQSELRKKGNSEILFLAERREGKGRASPRDLPVGEGRERELAGLHAETRLRRALAGPFDPSILLRECDREGRLVVHAGGGDIVLPSYRGLLFESGAAGRCAGLGPSEKDELAKRLEPALLPDNGSACEVCARLMEAGVRDPRLQTLALGWLRKLAHRKYAPRFDELKRRFLALTETAPEDWNRLRSGLSELERLFAARVEGAKPRMLSR